MNRIHNTLQILIKRDISTTCRLDGKKNFRKFLLYNKRGTRLFKEAQAKNPDPDIPIDKRGVRDTGYTSNGIFHEVPERIPELIVPDLTGCRLLPYVSYKVPDVVQTEFTSQDLFNAIYAEKIIEDYKLNKLNEDGSPFDSSPEESLSATEALMNAKKTGSDIF